MCASLSWNSLLCDFLSVITCVILSIIQDSPDGLPRKTSLLLLFSIFMLDFIVSYDKPNEHRPRLCNTFYSSEHVLAKGCSYWYGLRQKCKGSLLSSSCVKEDPRHNPTQQKPVTKTKLTQNCAATTHGLDTRPSCVLSISNASLLLKTPRSASWQTMQRLTPLLQRRAAIRKRNDDAAPSPREVVVCPHLK